MFECEISWNLNSGMCIASECGAGSVMKLKASVSFCANPPVTMLQMEMKICVDVVSDFF